MSDGADPIARGRAAWAAIHHATTFESWKAVALAVALGRRQAMHDADVNAPFGTKYRTAINRWLETNGFGGMRYGVRVACCKLVDELQAIEAWRDALPPHIRDSQNNPEVCLRSWRRSIKPPREPVAQHRPAVVMSGPKGRSVHWHGDHIRRAGLALRESYSTDIFVMARKALEAAIRSEGDLLVLLDPPARSTPQRARAVDMSALPKRADIVGPADWVRRVPIPAETFSAGAGPEAESDLFSSFHAGS